MAGRPITIVAVAFALGCVVADHVVLPAFLLGDMLIAGVLLAMVLGRRNAGLRGLGVAFVSATLGCACLGYDARIPDTHPRQQIAPGDVTIQGYATTTLPMGQGSRQFVLHALRAEQGGQVRPVDGNVVVSVFRRSPTVPVRRKVEVSGRLRILDSETRDDGFDALTFYRRRYGAYQLVRADDVRVLPGTVGGLMGGIARVRERMRGAILATMPRAYPSLTTDLMLSTVIGLRSVTLPKVIEEDFRRAGTIHVLVVSGSQVALVAALIFALTRRAGSRRRWLALSLCVPAVALYTLLAGAEASVARAAVMGGLAAFALGARRDYDIIAALAAAATVLMLISPYSVFNVGFQLSVAAVVGIAVFVPEARRRAPGEVPEEIRGRLWRRQWGAIILRVNLAAWVMTTPLLLHYFKQASISGLVANLIVVPAAGVLTVCSAVACVVVWWMPGWAWCLNHVNSVLVEVMVRTTALFAHVPGAVIPHDNFTWFHVAVWYGVVFGGFHLSREGHARRAAEWCRRAVRRL